VDIAEEKSPDRRKFASQGGQIGITVMNYTVVSY
jgi:hypothetical protein